MEGKDVLATAQTGTGKTLAFLIPVMEKLVQRRVRLESVRWCYCPRANWPCKWPSNSTRSVEGSLRPRRSWLADYPKARSSTRFARERRIVIATPGRLEDFLDRRLVRLDGLQTLVLDEADRMLDMGFLPSIRRIVSILPKERQTMCFSATMEASVAHLVKDYMRNPVRLAFGSTLKPSENVRLQAFEVSTEQKHGMLCHLLNQEKGRCLVFSRTKRGTDRIAKLLKWRGIDAAVIHGDRSQSQRTAALAGFQQGRHRVLVATDVASRGIHVENIAHVINYDLPDLAENFIHRVGRTGRAGAQGVATTLFSRDQRTEIFQLERTLGLKIERLPVDLGSLAKQEKDNEDRLNRMAPAFKRQLVRLPGEYLQAQMQG